MNKLPKNIFIAKNIQNINKIKLVYSESREHKTYVKLR